MRASLLTIAFSVIALQACQSPPPQPIPVDAESVKTHFLTWAKLVSAGDVAAATELLAPDVWWAGSPPTVGRDAAVASMKTWPKLEMSVDVQEVGGMGDLAYARAMFTEKISGADGRVTTEHVVCLGILQRVVQTGNSTGWQFTRSSCHSIDPLAAAK